MRFSFDRPAGGGPISSDEYPFSLTLGCSCCVVSLFHLADSHWLSGTPSHLPRTASGRKPPDGVLIEVESHLRACSPLVRLLLSPSRPFWTYRGLHFTRSYIYLLFNVSVIPKRTILSIRVWSLANACENRLKSPLLCHYRKKTM